jgi:hypothetical protein
MFLSHIKIYSVGFCVLAGVFFQPSTALAQTPAANAISQQDVGSVIAALLEQIELLREKLAEQKLVEARAHVAEIERPQTVYDGAPVLNRYVLDGESSVRNITNYQHRQYLEQIYEIFPQKYANKLVEFAVFKDKNGDYGAFVETVPPHHLGWSFAINTDLLGNERTESSRELIVHELAHIISYESIEDKPLPQSAYCHTYFRTRGCPKENSYLAGFAEVFWETDDLNRAKEFRRQDDAIDEAYDYYEENKDEYVSGYAALSPEEDFAESFAQYVVARKPRANTVASKKVWWFDQFAELKKIRNSIN